MNDMLNKVYWTTWANLGNLDPREEQGVETIEWIAVAAVILILLLAVQQIFKPGGVAIGSLIIVAIIEWIQKFT